MGSGYIPAYPMLSFCSPRVFLFGEAQAHLWFENRKFGRARGRKTPLKAMEEELEVLVYVNLGGGFKVFFMFIPIPGNDPI